MLQRTLLAYLAWYIQSTAAQSFSPKSSAASDKSDSPENQTTCTYPKDPSDTIQKSRAPNIPSLTEQYDPFDLNLLEDVDPFDIPLQYLELFDSDFTLDDSLRNELKKLIGESLNDAKEELLDEINKDLDKRFDELKAELKPGASAKVVDRITDFMKILGAIMSIIKILLG